MTEPSITPPMPPGGSWSEPSPTLRPIPRWVIAIGIPVMVLIAVAAIWLLLSYGVTGDRLDAIRTGGTLGVGLGGAVVLWLSVHRQRSAELDLLQKYEAHRLAERVAAHTAQDAAERRITELYTKAADQLGSDKAPVRLAGLYALERLAQDNPRLRQTIVNVLCAYLRMPCALPTTPANVPRPLGRRRMVRPGRTMPRVPHPTAAARSDSADTARQEREVRLTAQAILTAHLQFGPDPERPAETFWDSIDLDLTGAALIDLNLTGCRVGVGGFTRAKFVGDAGFNTTEFTMFARFDGAEFSRNASFENAKVGRDASFICTKVAGTASFGGAKVAGFASFLCAEFAGNAWFDDADFGMGASFSGAKFAGKTAFTRAKIAGDPEFRNARFERGVPLEVARFVRDTEMASPADGDTVDYPDASA